MDTPVSFVPVPLLALTSTPSVSSTQRLPQGQLLPRFRAQPGAAWSTSETAASNGQAAAVAGVASVISGYLGARSAARKHKQKAQTRRRQAEVNTNIDLIEDALEKAKGVAKKAKGRPENISEKEAVASKKTEAVIPTEEGKVKFTVVTPDPQEFSGGSGLPDIGGITDFALPSLKPLKQLNRLVPDSVKPLFDAFYHKRTQEEEEHRVSQYPLSAERLREGDFEDFPWIALTLATLSMSPVGIQSENFVIADTGSRVGIKTVPDGRLGFGQVRPLEDDASGPVLLASLFVVPEFRRCGLGSRIVQELIARRRRQFPDCDPSEVYALTLQSRVPFFERQGFGIVATAAQDDSFPSLEEVKLPLALTAEATAGQVVAQFVAGESLVVMRVVAGCRPKPKQ